MKFFQKRGDTSTIRKVWDDEKAHCYGIVGTMADLSAANIITLSEGGDPGLWLFIANLGTVYVDHLGTTREEACEELENLGKVLGRKLGLQRQ